MYVCMYICIYMQIQNKFIIRSTYMHAFVRTYMHKYIQCDTYAKVHSGLVIVVTVFHGLVLCTNSYIQY